MAVMTSSIACAVRVPPPPLRHTAGCAAGGRGERLGALRQLAPAECRGAGGRTATAGHIGLAHPGTGRAGHNARVVAPTLAGGRALALNPRST